MQSQPPKIFFSVGEPSGDLHGANLIRQLRHRRPDVKIVGYGGPKMAEAGCELHEDLTALAVMWFARVLVNLHKFWGLVSRADRYFRHHRPDAVVLIDYPGMNWWIARRAKAHGIPVFYYTPPQIWAWARWRVKKMRRLVDHVLCSLPFEEPWFRSHGCNATFVGHPFFDEVRRYPYDERFIKEFRNRPGPLVLILPGSRTQEVTNNLRWFLKAAAIIRERVPDARFAVAAFKPHQAEIAGKMIEEAASGGQSHIRGEKSDSHGQVHGAAKIGQEENGDRHLLPERPFGCFAQKVPVPVFPAIEVYLGKTPELMQLADCAMSVSGSVSLELLYHTTPTVILYWITGFAYFVQTFFRKVKYITLVNLLATGGLSENDITPFDPSQPDAARVPFPEYLTCEDRSQQIAGHIVKWLCDPKQRTERIEALRTLKEQVAHGGASGRAADYILNMLAQRSRRWLDRGSPCAVAAKSRIGLADSDPSAAGLEFQEAAFPS